MAIHILKNLDLAAIEFCGRFARSSELFDNFFVGTLGRPTFKFLPLIAALWFIWFDENNKNKNRTTVICAFLSSGLAIVISRAIQNLSPKNLRPMHDDSLTQFVAPFGSHDDVVQNNWSSFPSDHAAIAFAISLWLFFYNKALGVLSVVFIMVVICAPRVYAGYHYVSDIIGGAIIGFLCAFAIYIIKNKIHSNLMSVINYIELEYRPFFYCFSIVISYQVVTMFNDIRWPLMALINYF